MKQNIRWSIKALVLSVFLSIVFGMISQGLFPALPPFLSVLIILFFIIVSVVFDMIGVAFTTLSKNIIIQKYQKDMFFETLVRLCENKDKISSFCGDIVGDICGILSGAGGVSLVVNMNLADANIYFIITCIFSSLIAGLTIFGKAYMKGYAVKNCEKIAVFTSKTLNLFQKKSKNA